MDITAMKRELRQLYSGDEWANKVRNMGPRQIIAIYMNCQRRHMFRGMFDPYTGEPLGQLVDLPGDKEPNPFHQVTIFEYMLEKGV